MKQNIFILGASLLLCYYEGNVDALRLTMRDDAENENENETDVQTETEAEKSKKADTSAWDDYKSTRGDHDCKINENKNWLGIQRCAYNWECKGGRICSRFNPGKDDGWCSGDSLCAEMGPLDYFNKDGQIVWAAGSGTYDGFDGDASQYDSIEADVKKREAAEAKAAAAKKKADDAKSKEKAKK